MTFLRQRVLATVVAVILVTVNASELPCTLPASAQGTVAHVSIVELSPPSANSSIFTQSIFTSSDEGGATYVAGYAQNPGAVYETVRLNFGGNCDVVELTQGRSVLYFGYLTKYACNGTCLWVRTFRETSWYAYPQDPTFAPGSVKVKAVKVGRDRGIYIAGELGCVGPGHNVTFANLTWSSPHPALCSSAEIAFAMKLNADATAVLWYLFGDYSNGPTDDGVAMTTLSLKLDNSDNVYWLFQTQTGLPFELVPNTTSNYTRISTTWGTPLDPRDCVIVKLSGANGGVQWWNAYGELAPFTGQRQCFDMDVSRDGVRGSLLHWTTSEGLAVLYPCGVSTPATNSVATTRVTTFNATNGQCVATAGFGNNGNSGEPRAIVYAPDSSDAVYIQGMFRGVGASCMIFPPLAAVKCITGTDTGFVAKLHSVTLRGIWAIGLSASSAPSVADGSIDVSSNGLASDGLGGLVATGSVYRPVTNTLCLNAAVFCNSTNAIAQFAPTSGQYMFYTLKLSTQTGAMQWVSIYRNVPNYQETTYFAPVSSYGLNGYGMWTVTAPLYQTSNDTTVFGESIPYYPDTLDDATWSPVVFHADTMHGVSGEASEICDTCMNLYNTDTPHCDLIRYEGNVTWSSVASGTNLDTDIVDIRTSFIHTDGTVYAAGRLNAAPTGNLDFGGNCGLVGVGPVGNPFIAKYDSCTGQCTYVAPFFSMEPATILSIKINRAGIMLLSGVIDCLTGPTVKMCVDATANEAACVVGQNGNIAGCQNSTANKFGAWLFAVDDSSGLGLWSKQAINAVTPVSVSDVQLDNAYPVQTAYWMTQQTAGPGISGNGIFNSVPDARNVGGNGWASGQPVDCVLWAVNSVTGALGITAAYGDEDPSPLKQCRSMSVTSDGTRVAIAMTVSGAAVTLQPCDVFYPGGKGVDTRVVYINTATFACITTTVFSSAGVFNDAPWRLAFGLYGSLYIVGETDHTGPSVTGMTFPPLAPLSQGHQMDGWVARLDYSAAANNLSGVWAHSISSDGQDTCLSLATDGHYGVTVAGIYGSTHLCMDQTGYCGSGNAFASTAVNNTQVFVIKFDGLGGTKLWHRLYTTNTTFPTTTRSLSVSAFGNAGYGFWAVTGSGRQIQQSRYTFGDASHTYAPYTANNTFGFVTKHLDTAFGISNDSLADGCSSSPCQNGGLCRVTYTDTLTPICECVAGYSGTFCQTNINECDSSPCVDGAQCVDGVNSYYCTYCLSSPCQNGGTCVTLTPLPDYACTCASGYSGTRCQTAIDECASSPCQNGGTCTDAANRYSCTCAVGYSGPLCQTDIDDCVSAPCRNGGTCVDALNRLSCTCAAGYSGLLCQTAVDECASSPCQNSGTCTDGANRFTCTCTAGYSGNTCQTNLDECASTPCLNGGTCSDALNRYACTCPAGYSGSICQTDIDECASTPCQNSGTCVGGVNRYTCTCVAGYSGPVCQTDINECASTPCQNSGTCTDGANIYTCTCATGYSGRNCQTDIDDCASSPCRNGGTCTDALNRYSCSCAGGYSGVYCQTNIDECASSPCLSSGTCVDGVNGHTCTCSPGYSGRLCQTQIDECLSTPCQNGASCEGAVNGFSCHCLPGYSGVRCQSNINECASLPCLNSGTCTDNVNTYSCVCASGYSGLLCQTEIDECASTPCRNGGTCTDTPGRYTCACPGGYSGWLCQTNIDECASSPCQNSGTCTDGTNAYVCTCAPGYSGGKCQTNINECASSPCFNGGTCTDATNRFSCSCAPGYSGVFCQTNINECTSSPCRNSATCYDMVNSFFCACPSGYTGASCQTDINECATTNGGCDTLTTCANTDGSRTCGACPEGYTGTGAAGCFLLEAPCGSTPCQNGGTCAPDGSSGLTCTCPVQFTGSLCQTDVNECVASNGGCDPLTNCTNLVGSYGCGPCPFGYTGNGLIGCTNVDSACASSPCQNGATCNSVALNVVYNCTCASGFVGTQCQTDINECATAHGGCDPLSLCVNTPGSRLCSACPAGYFGTGYTVCTLDTDDCASSPCQHGGTCTDSTTRYTCACAAGYSGSKCQSNINECASSPCRNGGTCVDGVNRFTCTCDSVSFMGTLCQTGVESCLSQPCQHAGVCAVTDGGANYTCACQPGYSGLQCQSDIDECVSFPCQNGGNCTDLVNGFACNCTGTPGNGTYCQHSDCDSSPCQNGAVCTARLVTNSTLDNSTFTCTCPSNYYVGRLCQTFAAAVPLDQRREDIGQATALSLVSVVGVITLASIGVIVWYWRT